MKFFGYAVILLAIASIPVSGLAGEHSWLIWFFLALNGLAAAIGSAVVRSRYRPSGPGTRAPVGVGQPPRLIPAQAGLAALKDPGHEVRLS